MTDKIHFLITVKSFKKMSIQQQVSEINARSRSYEYALLIIVGAIAMASIANQMLWVAVVALLIYIPLSITLQNWLKEWREARILEVYKFVHEPIFEIQYDADDRFVHARSEEHRRRLNEAGNELYKQNLITVEEIYYKDVRFKFTESPEEYEERRQNFIDDYLNTWAKNLGEKNQKLVKQWLYNQELNEVTTTTYTPSVKATENGDFFTTQFPMLSRLLRGKEVVVK